jgi:Outer membrane protein and related peptidoglycan-associated (lipo)proteins
MESAYAKSGFVAGDDIIFDDPMDNETVGEFPSQWSLLRETSEVVDVNGKKTLVLSNRYTSVTPQMGSSKNYLGDVFTLEFDYFQPVMDNYRSKIFQITFYTPDSDSRIMSISKQNDPNDNRLGFSWLSNSGHSSTSAEVLLATDEWHHFSVSFNKQIWRVYIDGVRVANVPNVANAPGWVDMSMQNGSGDLYLTNFRIAQGASKLSDRVESEGKFVSYGITFDTAKSTIKPESLGELSRIAQLMSDNPALKFSVEGHCDNTGDPATSRTLTEARAKVVVEKLVQMGVASNRLTSAGKGQENPIADNGTNVGRAKNNRIVFVKQ